MLVVLLVELDKPVELLEVVLHELPHAPRVRIPE